MTLETLEALATLVIALSAANERLVESLKALFAPWLAKEQTATGGIADPVKDRWRRLAVQILSVLCALVVASMIAASQGETFGSAIQVGSGANERRFHVVLVALLTTGGSAFWNSIIDFARGAAKLKEQKSDSVRLINSGNLPVSASSAPPVLRDAAAAQPTLLTVQL